MNLGSKHLEFEPTSGTPTVGLQKANDEFLVLRDRKWYFEVTIGKGSLDSPRFGWCDERFMTSPPNTLLEFDGVGDDAYSWGIDGVRMKKRHDVMSKSSRGRASTWRRRAPAHDENDDGDGEDYGEEWKPDDLVGCMADLDRKSLSFSLNGKDMGPAFDDIDFEGGLFPALTASANGSCTVTCNFGEDPQVPLKHKPDGYFEVVPQRAQVANAQPTGMLELMHNNRKISPWLLSMQHVFEKFEGGTWWYGVYLMSVRLLETSMLVFFRKRSSKASTATAVAVVSLVIAEKCSPWLSDSDDKVRDCKRRASFACTAAY